LKIPKTRCHILLEKISLPNRNSTSQKEANKKICKTCSDMDQPRNTSKDPLHISNGVMTRSKTKALKEALNALVLNVSTKSKIERSIRVSREDPSTSYPCARGVQHKLIWAMR
jgi:hypothetical protein